MDDLKPICLNCKRKITNQEFEYEDYYLVTRGFTPEAKYNYLCFDCVDTMRSKEAIGFWDK